MSQQFLEFLKKDNLEQVQVAPSPRTPDAPPAEFGAQAAPPARDPVAEAPPLQELIDRATPQAPEAPAFDETRFLGFLQSTDVGGAAIPEIIRPRLTIADPADTFEISRGVGRGGINIAAEAAELTGILRDLVGNEEGRDEVFEVAERLRERGDALFPRLAPEKVEDIDDLGGFIDFAAASLGEQVPVIASIIGTGGFGLGVGRVVGRMAARGAITQAAAKRLIQKFATRGAIAGGVAGASGLEAAGINEELRKATGETSPVIALTAGTVAGLLETLTPLGLARRFGLGSAASSGLVSKITGAFLKGGVLRTGAAAAGTELTTEFLQETVALATREFVDENFELIGPEAASRLLNAAVTGALVGGIFGGVGGSLASSRPIPPGNAQPANDDVLRRARAAGQSFTTTAAQGELFPIDDLGITPEDTDPSGGQPIPGVSPSDFGQTGPEADIDPRQIEFFDPTTLVPQQQTGPLFTPQEVAERGQRFPNHVDDMRITFSVGVLHGADINGQPIRLDDNTVQVAAHRPELTEALPSLSDSMRREHNLRLNKLAGQYERLIKAFGLTDHKLVISPVGTTQNNERGWYGNFTGNTHVIHLNARSTENITTFASTAFHEFGHFLQATALEKAPPQTREALLNAFQRSQLRRTQQSSQDFVVENRSLGTVEAQARSLPTTDIAAIAQDENFSKWWDFDEWLSEQVSRWVFTSPRAITITDKFFKSVGTWMKNTIKILIPEKFDRVRAEAEVEAWLQDLADRRNTNQTPYSQPVVTTGIIEGKQQNAKLLQELGIKEMPAPQGASRNVSTAAAKGLIDIEGRNAKELVAEVDYYNSVVKWGFNIIQIAAKNKHIRGLQRYVELVRSAFNFKMNWVARADGTLKEWRNLSQHQSKALGEFLLDMDALTYMRTDEDTARPRWPTQDEFVALARKHKLDTETLEVYIKVRDDFASVIDQMESTLTKEARAAFAASPDLLQVELTRIATEMRTLRERPYFPHMRFGKFLTAVRDPETGALLFSEQYEGRRAQDRALKRIQKEFPKAAIAVTKLPEKLLGMRGFPPAMIKRLTLKLLEGSELTQAQKDEILKRSEELAFEFSPAQSFKHRLARRKGIAGFSDDAMRAYASYFFFGANHLMRIEFRPELEAQIKDVVDGKNAIDRAEGTPQRTEKRQAIIDFMDNHLDSFMNPLPDWAMLRSVAFQFHLGMALDSVVLNLTQVPMVALPYLSARFNDVSAAAQLTKAVFDLRKIYQNKPGKLPADEFQALDRAMKEGFINESMATELAGVAQSNMERTLPGNAAAQSIKQAGVWSAFMFQQSEMLNRRVVFRAAYRLAKGNPTAKYLEELAQANELTLVELNAEGMTREEALAYLAGRDAVQATMFEYAAWGRPRFMRGKKGVLFTFFMFSQNMLWFARFQPGRARYLTMLAATAGVMGLPGAEDLFEVAQFIWRRLGNKEDLKVEARKFIQDNIVDNPDWVLHGAASQSFGLGFAAEAIGLPVVPTVDFSRRIGLGKVIPGVEGVSRLSNANDPGDFSQAFGSFTEDVGGAAFSIPVQMLKALMDGHPDIYARWARVFPRSIRNVAKALDTANKGAVEARDGTKLVEFNTQDPGELAELIAMGLGFNPTRVARRWDVRRMQQEAAMYWANQQGMLLQQLDYVSRRRDQQGIKDVMQSIARFNNEVPFGLHITSRAIRQSLRSRARRRAFGEAGIATTRRQIPLSREILSLFPDVKADIEANRERNREVISDEKVR